MPADDNTTLANLAALNALSLGAIPAPPVNPHANALAQYFSGNAFTISGRWYQKKRVQLDGYKFIRCRFDDCILATAKGTFEIDHCFFSKCTIEFSDAAHKIVKLYNVTATEAWTQWPSLTPTYHADDGTYSVSLTVNKTA